jgi:hypothetical protein
VPPPGEYVNEPGTFAVAFNWVALNDAPDIAGAGDSHVITGTARVTFRLVVELELAVYEE